jgi:hypothetical protein
MAVVNKDGEVVILKENLKNYPEKYRIDVLNHKIREDEDHFYLTIDANKYIENKLNSEYLDENGPGTQLKKNLIKNRNNI